MATQIFHPGTVDHVQAHTDDTVNRHIREEMEIRLGYYAAHPREIGQRLDELNREWDIERVLEVNAASFSLLGITLAATAHPLWLLFPTIIAAFLLLHAVQGWCPPLPVFRRLGIRTATEINEERYALKALQASVGNAGTSAPEI
jgi:hypothetical protein